MKETSDGTRSRTKAKGTEMKSTSNKALTTTARMKETSDGTRSRTKAKGTSTAMIRAKMKSAYTTRASSCGRKVSLPAVRRPGPCRSKGCGPTILLLMDCVRI